MHLPFVHRTGRVGQAFIAAIGAAALVISPAVGIGHGATARADGLTYQVTNYDDDGTIGVYGRNSSDVNDVSRDAAHFLGYGTTINLVCGLSGSAVGPQSNTAWDEVQVVDGPNAGLTTYLSEHWLNTPVGPNQHVSGEPDCSSGGGPSATAQAAINWASGYVGQSYDSRLLPRLRRGGLHGGRRRHRHRGHRG